MAKKTIAVMGATGHIGTALTQDLLSKGHAVRALGRDEKKLAALAAKGAATRSSAFTDPAALAEGFAGADAAFVMIPPSYAEADFGAYQDLQTDAIVKALRKSGVKKVVSLSSIGAQHPQGTGPIAGLRRMEQKLNQAGVDVVHLRPGYFMQNHLHSISTIKSIGANASALKPDLPVPQIATRDIARKAAEILDRMDFRGSSVAEFSGPRDLTLKETTAVLGRAIGKPDLSYVQVPYADVERALAGIGMPAATATMMVEIDRGLNEGLIRAEKPAVAERTATTLDEFAASVFAPAFQA